MSLTCDEEEESSLMSNMHFCPPVNEHTMASSHRSPSAEEVVKNSKVATYEIEELSIDDAEVLGMWSSEHQYDEEDFADLIFGEEVQVKC